MGSLYNLTNEFLLIAQQLEEMELDQETFSATLESLQFPIEEKAENIIKLVKNYEAMAEARKNEAKRLNELAAKDLKKVENLLNYLDDNLKKANIQKLNAGVFQVSYRKGSEVVEVDETRLPEQYFKTVRQIAVSKPELKKLLKDGQEIEGVSLVRKQDSLVVK